MLEETTVPDVASELREFYKSRTQEEMSLMEYLDLCASDPSAYASAAERMLAAIGEPQLVDTSQDLVLGRIFMNRTIKTYPAFADFYGMEEVIESVVGFFKQASQGLEERKQILYLLGPVGGGKSSLADHLKMLMEQCPIYVLKADDEVSPVYESPLGLFDPVRFGKRLEEKYQVPKRYLSGIASPWAQKRLQAFDRDVTKFKVIKLFPSKAEQIAITRTEPGDENNQDVSTLVGKVDIRRLERFSQNDTDAYSYSGSLNRATQGLMEFVEMFKAPIKMLHPLLTATQDRSYVGTENIGLMPYQGIILAHSNEAEWISFRNNKNNEAFLDRVSLVKVPYCLRVSEEVKIYQKLIRDSGLSDAPIAPSTLEMLAKFGVASRLKEPEDNSSLAVKMRVYDGEDLKGTDVKAKPLSEYREEAGVDEGMTGISTRFNFKALSKTLNFDAVEVAADPVHLMSVLAKAVKNEQLPNEKEKELLTFIKDTLGKQYAEEIGHEIQRAYLESYSEYGQNLFDRYVDRADSWVEDLDYKDPDTGQLLDRETLDKELSQIEKPAGIANPKDFRNEIVKYCLRHRGKPGNEGKNPKWTEYVKIREVIEKRMFGMIEELLPVISFGGKSDTELERKHSNFVDRMKKHGYTERQVRRLVDWFILAQKSN